MEVVAEENKAKRARSEDAAVDTADTDPCKGGERTCDDGSVKRTKVDDVAGNTASASTGSRASRRNNAQQQPCFAWLKGTCTRDKCKFKHDAALEGSQPDGAVAVAADPAAGATTAREYRDPLALSGTIAGVLDRGFAKWFRLDAGNQLGCDMYVHLHGNGLMMIGLAPTHEYLAGTSAPKIVSVTFRAEVNDSDVYGKRNKGGLKVNPATPLADVILSTGAKMTLCAAVEAQLIEVNEQLSQEPQLLQSDAEGAGHLAILQLQKPGAARHIVKGLVDEVGLVESRGEAAFARGKTAAPRWAPPPQHSNADVGAVVEQVVA